MNVRRLLTISSISSGVLLIAGTAFACPGKPSQPTCPSQPACASVTAGSVVVNQSQAAWSTHPVDLTQSASTIVESRVGEDAWAISKNAASQGIWNANKAVQNQKVASGAAIVWKNGVWPAPTTAQTQGGTWQNQAAWGAQPMKLVEEAATWQESFVGGNKSTIDGSAKQENVGAVGDAKQSQDIFGQTRADGFVNPPFPSTHSLFGGKVLTNITVFVQSLLQF